MEHLIKIRTLYTGRLCEVNLLKNKTTNELLVVKKIYLVNIINSEEKGHIQNEIQILYKFKNNKISNIITFYNGFQDKDFIYLYLEYCNGGTIKDNLDKYINKTSLPFPEKYVQYLMKQILLGVKYLHDNGIIHRDLKLKNILLKYNNDYDLNNLNILSAQVKIIDFNLSYIKNKNNYKPISAVGTLQNMAPSIIYNFKNEQKKCYDEKVDIWSLGTLCYEMLFGKPLFQNMTQEEICNNIINANFYIDEKKISIQAREFLYCMLQKNNDKRYSAGQLLEHYFIKGDYHKFTMYNDTIKIKKSNYHKFITMNDNDNKNKNLNAIKLQKINVPKVLVHYNSRDKLMDKTIQNIKLNSPQKKENKCKTGYTCKGCYNYLYDIYYKCQECDNFYYCKKCYFNNLLNTHDHNHGFHILGGAFGSKEYDPKVHNKTFEILISYDQNIQMINVIFKNDSQKGTKDIIIPVQNDEKIGKLIENYFYTIGRSDLISNYINRYIFYYNGHRLNHRLGMQIREIFLKGGNPVVNIVKTEAFAIKNKFK